MSLYEYQCLACGHSVEKLVRTSGQAACPACDSSNVERLLSTFGVSSAARSHSALQAARRDFTYGSGRQDQMRHEQEKIREHVQEDYGLRVPKPED